MKLIPERTRIRKGATIIVFSKDLDKVLASLVIANGAAATGSRVTMFFTFWGLAAIRDPKKTSSQKKDLMDTAFSSMLPKGVNNLGLSSMNFGGLGTLMMKKDLKMKNLPTCKDLLTQAKRQGVRMIACTMSMTAMGIAKDELLDGLEFGGVADYLADAEDSGTNLFI